MALKKVYFGSFGPFLYDDTDPINDSDGDFAGEDHQAMTTDGQMRVEQGPVANEEVIRLIDLGFRLLPPVSVVDIDNPTELNALAGDLGALVLAYQIIGATGLNKYTTYAYDASGPAVDAPNVVDAAGAGDERWIALGMKGPASALDNEVPVFDGTTGKKIKAGSGLIITTNLMQAADKAVLLSGTTGGTPASGAGTRMMWIPAKAAFRAGYATGTAWDNVNIGMYSFSAGVENKASGMMSGVMSGWLNTATALYSGVMTGYSNDALANGAGIMSGAMNEISGDYSGILTGQGNVVSGQSSGILGGTGNSVGGPFAGILGGEKNYAHGNHSIVAGKYMQLSAAADNSFAFGHHSSAVALTQPNTFYIFPGGTAGKVAVGTATPATSAIMDLTSTIGAFLPPRMTTAQKNALTPLGGMVLHDNTLNRTQTYEAGEWRSVGNIPGSAQGQLGFWNHTLKSWVHTETSELFWDDTNKRLGIGTATADEQLHLHGTDKGIRITSSEVGNDGMFLLKTSVSGGYISGYDSSGNKKFIIRSYAHAGAQAFFTGGNIGIGIETPATSALLDITSTTGALLLPRMTTAQRDALTAVNGMLLYDTTLNQTQTYENGVWRQI